jgi:hypothetical protein
MVMNFAAYDVATPETEMNTGARIRLKACFAFNAMIAPAGNVRC